MNDRLNFFINLNEKMQEGNVKFYFCQAFINMFLFLVKNNSLTFDFCCIALAYQIGYIYLPFKN